MNSSGIKRGLATTAVSALAIAGIPFIASSANAAVGDELVTAFAGPARNGGAEGAVVVLETKGAGINPANFRIIKSDLTGDADDATGNPNNASQTISLVSAGAVQADGPANEFGNGDGYGESTLRVSVLTPNPGGTATFAVFNDDDADGVVDAGEARTQVSISTAGAPTSVEISPNSQVASQGQNSGLYTVTTKDNAGRVTQLTGAESINLAANGGTALTDNSITIGDAPRGAGTFRASNANTGGYTITATGANGVPAGVTAQATLNVVTAGNIVESEVDVVTGADSWPTNPAARNYANTVNVRVGEPSVTLVFNAPNDANSTVTFVATSAGGNGLTFDGQATKSYSVVLDAQGKGQVVITPDAASVQALDGFTAVGSGLNFDFDFVRGTASDLQAANGQTATYISKVGGSVDVVVKVVDQFGLPITSGLVDVRRFGGVNNEAAFSAKKAVGADGTVTFTLTDTKGTANSTAADTVEARYFPDQFAAAATVGPETVGTIRYTADGTGDPISFTVDNTSVDGTGYNPTQITLNPLTFDGNATTQTVGANQVNDEFVVIGIVGGTAGAPVTVSADNGGLILRNPTAATDEVADGAASVTGVAGDVYQLIATKTGTINVTVSSAGKSKTAAVTAIPLSPAAGLASTARNVTVTGPTEAVSGDLAEFIVKVTDGYGNPVPGVSFGVNIRVTGPARLQDTSSTTNAAGEISVSVRLDDDADSPVTVSAEGLPAAGGFFFQFGDAANTISNAGAGANNAPGIPVSSNVATATISDVTNLEELEQAVEEAEAALEQAQADLAAAQGDLDVAQTELAVAQANVKALQAKKAELRKKLNKAKKNGNMKKAKAKRQQLRATKAQLADAKDEATVASAKVDAAQDVVTAEQADVAQAEADLAEAQENLDEAQN